MGANGLTVTSYFFQESGLMVVNKVQESSNPDVLPKSKGTLLNTKLVEVTVDGSYNTTPVPNGKCLTIESYNWDNTCTPNCTGKICGDDGCGGTCGAGCATDELCNAEGTTCNKVSDVCKSVSAIDIASAGFAMPAFEAGWAYAGLLDPFIGEESLDDAIVIEFWREAYADEPYESDLSTQTSYSSCDECINVYEDIQVVGENYEMGKIYFQKSGKMMFDRVFPAGPMNQYSKGSLDNVLLIQVTNQYVPIQGGSCLIVNGSWDTMPECTTSLECPADQNKDVCDPATWTCIADCNKAGNECSEGLLCNENSGICEKPQGDNNRCDGTSPITTITDSGTFTVNTADPDKLYTNDYAPTKECSERSVQDNGKDAAFKIELAVKSDIEIIVTDGPTASWGGKDTVIWLGTTCGAADLGCNDDIGGANMLSQVSKTDLSAGTYYLMLDTNGKKSEGEFAFTVTITPKQCALDNECQGEATCAGGKCVCKEGYAGANCDTCAANYHDESGTCVSNTKPAPCDETNPPANSTAIAGNVEITWNGTEWSIPAKCDFKCDDLFHKEGDACVSNTKTVACNEAGIPANSTATQADVQVTWNGTEWTAAAVCEWTCNANYHQLANTCESNTKLVDCDASVTPENATATYAEVEIRWNNGVWSDPATCEWDCNEDYHNNNGTCESNTKLVACDETNPPANSTAIPAQVEIIWTGTEWPTTPKCDYACDATFTKSLANPGTCVDNPCDPEVCSVNGLCTVDNTDAAVCECTTGYAGDTCSSCDTGYHDVAGTCIQNILIANADFSNWTNDTTPEGWTTTTAPTITKIDRADTNGFAINLNKTYTGNFYALNSAIINANDGVPSSITFDLKGSGKMSINIRCGAPCTTDSTYKVYNIVTPDDQILHFEAGNQYRAFSAPDWTTYTIDTGAELNDLWKSDMECKIEIKAGKDVLFDASMDNFKVNY